MNSEKPKDINEYKKWLKDKHRIEISDKTQKHYETVANSIKNDFEKSVFWIELNKNLIEFNDQYHLEYKYDLLETTGDLRLEVKPFDSFILKTYRKNIIENNNWPNVPEKELIIPSNWFSKIDDIVRTCLVVKYLDGVEWLTGKIKNRAEKNQIGFREKIEAREEGYYAAHLYVKQQFEVPRIDWDTEKINVEIELQITTQMQDLIRRLLHKYYEIRRGEINIERKKWQWNYRSDEFATNYLGHILHYVEGMIMDIREKQKETKNG